MTELGHHVVSATTVTEAERAAAAGGIDLAIIDYHLKHGKTEDVARRLKTAGIPFVVCSGSSGLQEMGDIFQGTTFLAKPFTTEGPHRGSFKCHDDRPWTPLTPWSHVAPAPRGGDTTLQVEGALLAKAGMPEAALRPASA